jgi:hypothetical protein
MGHAARRYKKIRSVMNPTLMGLIAFACTFGGALFGMALRRLLPTHHFDDPSKETIKGCVGLDATMTALVLGLVTASAKSADDVVDTAVKHIAVDLLVRDRTAGPLRA